MELEPVPGRDGWVEVRHEGLEQPFRMRLGARQGRFVVLGIEIDNDAGVTTRTLRSIRLGAALDAWNYWVSRDLAEADAWDDQLAQHRAKRRAQGIELSADEVASLESYGRAVSAEATQWRELLERLPHAGEPTGERRAGAAPPTEEELQQFARAYVEEYLRRPRGAVTRVAQRRGMHRVTAHRWINLCREKNYLPTNEEDA